MKSDRPVIDRVSDDGADSGRTEDALAGVRALHEAAAAGDLDLHFARMMVVLAGRDDPELALAAALASRATSAGNVCVDLGDIAGTWLPDESLAVVRAPEMGRWRAALERCAVVATEDDVRAGDRRPLVLDRAGRLFLYRYWQYQDGLARRLLEFGDAELGGDRGPDEADLRARLDGLFPRSEALGAGEVDWQKVAAAVAVLRRLCVVSGGPGTGKTTTVTKILALLIDASPDRVPRIGLAAPTGKAAARLAEAIRAAKQRLALGEHVAAAIPEDTSTIHRLLGYRHGSTEFRHGEDNPLPLDVLVIDEASMVDLALMAKLVAALPRAARLILIGDRDQLSSVEAGKVLGDICARVAGVSADMAARLERVTGESVPVASGAAVARNSAARADGIADSIVLLRRSYRFGSDSGIGAITAAVNAGDADRAVAILQETGRDDVGFAGIDALGTGLRQEVENGYREYLEVTDPRLAFAAFDGFRVLCARRTGPFGVAAMNARVETILGELGWIERGDPWYRGRPVLITQNDYGLRLFNGDVGIVFPDPDGDGAMRVFFPAADGEIRRIAPARLPAHETAFAMTVHKSQGSEFDRVLLVLPDEPSPVLTRELLYTGLSRARRHVEIRGNEAVFRGAITAAIERSSGLRDALWGSESPLVAAAPGGPEPGPPAAGQLTLF